jgi:hypothetical protein
MTNADGAQTEQSGAQNSTEDAPADETPDTAQLEEPSTEKEPEEEPKKASSEPEPSHEAVGIGVIGRPQVDPDPEPRDAPDA